MKLRRILALLLCAVMLCALPAGVYAEEMAEEAVPDHIVVEEETGTVEAGEGSADAAVEEGGEASAPLVQEPVAETAAEDNSDMPADDTPPAEEALDSTEEKTSSDEKPEHESVASDDKAVMEPSYEEETADDPAPLPTEQGENPGEAESPVPEVPESPVPEAPEAEIESEAETGTEDAEDTEVPPQEPNSEDNAAAPEPDRTPSIGMLSHVAAPTITISSKGHSGNMYCPPAQVTIQAPGKIQFLTCDTVSGGIGQTSYSFTLTNSGNTAYTSYTISVTDEAQNTISETILVGHPSPKPGSPERMEPSCESDGYEREPAYCALCGAFSHYQRNITIPKLDHDWKSQTYEVGQCGGTGEITVNTCSRCGKTEGGEIESLSGHQFTEKTKEATCQDPGYKYQECTNCQYIKDITEIPATGQHTYGEWKETTPATCEKSGIMESECTVCHQKFTKSSGAAKGHDWEEISREGSDCDQEGTRNLECKVCKETREEKISKLGHDFSVEVVDTEPGCTTQGRKHRVCSRCDKPETDFHGATKYIITPALGHNVQGVSWTSRSNAHYQICTRCKAEVNYSVHTPREDDQDCTTALTCSVCNYTLTAAYGGHDLKITSDETTHTTVCKRNGCSYSSTQQHTMTAGDSTDCTAASTCTVCGYVKPGTSFTNHKAGSTWETSGTEHWHKCINTESCQVKLNVGHHVPLPDDGDCTTAVTCMYCGAIYTPAKTEGHIFGAASHADGPYSLVYCQNPGCKQTKQIEHKMIEKSRSTIHAMSCTQDLVEEVTLQCEGCGHIEIETVTTPTTGHQWGAWETVTAGTCQAGEYQKRECSACHLTQTQNLSATGHEFGPAEIVTSASCDAPGVSRQTCSKCQAVKDTEIPALGHDYQVVSSTNPTCEEQGMDHKKCTRCQNEIDEPSAALPLGHDFQNYVSNNDAACTRNGTEKGKCTRCDAVVNREVPNSALGHSYNTDEDCTTSDPCLRCGQRGPAARTHTAGKEWLADAATGEHYRKCANEGCTKRMFVSAHIPEVDDDDCTTAQHCSVCGTVLKAGSGAHHFTTWNYQNANIHVRTCRNAGCHAVETASHRQGEVSPESGNASCTTPGSVTHRYYCADCGQIYKQTITDSQPLGHDFTDWEEMESPDCSNKGAKRRECRRCGLVEEQGVDPMGHDWEDKFTVDVEPTCDRDGSRSIHCSKPNCSATMDSQVIPALGHDFQRIMVVSPATCTNPLLEEVVCGDCGATTVRHSTAKEEGPLGHHFAAYLSDHNATCTVDGTETAACTRCGTIDTKPVEGSALGHIAAPGAQTRVIPATCTEEGRTLAACSRCGEEFALRTERPTGHRESKEADQAATCTSGGYVGASRCSVCGTTLRARRAIPALGHNYSGWTATGTGSHSMRCYRCGDQRIHTCSYSEMHIGAGKVDVCMVCGDVVDSTGMHVLTAGIFEIVENVKYEEVDPGAMPEGELVVRKLDIPFGDDREVLEAFTVTCELDGEALDLNGKVRVTMPLECEVPFLLYRVDEVENPENEQDTEEFVKLEYIYEDGFIRFETDKNGLFLIVPEEAEISVGERSSL